MKLKLIAASLLASVATTFAAGNGWLTNLEEARTKAAAENKPILIEFTGSDWCPPCKMLNQEVFATDTFKAKAPEKFVLVEMDFPRAEGAVTRETMLYRQKIAESYGITGYPTVILTDASGRPFAKTGFRQGGADDYLKHLDELLTDKAELDAKFTAAHALTGKQKAEALLALIKDKEASEINQYFTKELEAIKAADPEGSAEFVADLENKGAFEKVMEQISKQAEAKDWAAAQTSIDTFLARKGLKGELKQEALFTKAQILLQTDKKAEAITLLEASQKEAPKSRMARYIERLINHLKGQE